MSAIIPIKHAALPVIPRPGEPLTAVQIEKIETDVIMAIPNVADIGTADDWRRKGKAIEAYLRSPELQRPMLGAQRRIEARIGQLLGPAEDGGDFASWIESDLRAATSWVERDRYFETLSEAHKERFADLKWSLDAAEFGLQEASA
jgi:hypothetical protein